MTAWSRKKSSAPFYGTPVDRNRFYRGAFAEPCFDNVSPRAGAAVRLIEGLVALTILATAVNNLWPLVRERRWLAGFGFGLIHGIGYASVLGDLGLTGWSLAVPLLGFNVGVELAQLTVLLVFLPLAFVLRRTRFYRVAILWCGSLVTRTNNSPLVRNRPVALGIVQIDVQGDSGGDLGATMGGAGFRRHRIGGRGRTPCWLALADSPRRTRLRSTGSRLRRQESFQILQEPGCLVDLVFTDVRAGRNGRLRAQRMDIR